MVAPLSPDQARLAAIREALPATGAGIYLNAASAGPMPADAATAMAELAAVEARLGRGHPHDPLETLERIGEARAAFAAVLATDLGSIALTRGTDDGLRLSLDATGPARGERVIVVTGEGDAATAPVVAALGRRGVDAVHLVAGHAEDDAPLLDSIIRAFATPGGRIAAVIVPLVTGWTGRRLPVAAISAAARAAGAVVIVDGGAAVGAIPVDPSTSGADAIAFPAERWLLGPAGLGGLWCGPAMLDRMGSLHPVGLADGFAGGVAEAPWLDGASAWPRAAVTGVARAAGWLAMQVGLPWAWKRTARLVEATAGALAAIDGVTVATPPGRAAAIITFRIAGWTSRDALDELGGRVFAIAAAAPSIDAIRISLGAWTSEAELDRFLDGVRLLASHDPASLPPRRSLTVLP